MLHPSDIYLDYNASSPILPEVRQEILQLLDGRPVNPSSGHAAGQRSRRWLEAARLRVATLIGAEPTEVVFTSGGTEANVMVLAGIERHHVVLSAIEHRSILDCAESLRARGNDVTLVAPRDDGVVTTNSVLMALRSNTRLVCLMSANNETGVLQPVEELGRELQGKGVHFHVDAVQSAGRMELNVSRGWATTMTLSGHKLGSLPGVGALYLRAGTRMPALLRGGLQEGGRRAGTHNLPGIVSMGKACEIEAERRKHAHSLARLRDALEERLLAELPGSAINGNRAQRLPNTSNVSFEGVDGGELMQSLSAEGIHVAVGSACQAGAAQPSHVLRAMGYPTARVAGSIRISLGHPLAKDQWEHAVERIIAGVRALREGRRLSSVGPRK